MKSFKKNRAFTLVEIIISVAALSLICALVLKLFLLSEDVNKRAQIKQLAVIEASNIIERIKDADDIDEVNEMDFLSDSFDFTAEVKLIKDDELSTHNGGYYSIEVSISSTKGKIFELTGGKYFIEDE